MRAPIGPRPGFALLLFGLILASSLQTPLHAQAVVVGSVVERSTAEPLRGAFVVLNDSEGRRVAGVLTGQDGQYRLRAPSPGTYTLRAEHIGFESVQSRLLDIGTETVTHRFQLEYQPIVLDGVLADTDGRDCRVRPEDGTQLQELWERVRMALDVAVWTEGTGQLRSLQRTFERWADPVSGRVREEVERGSRGVGRVGFAAASPEELMAEGFIREQGDDYVFYGLDAATIVSDAFLDGHCFRLQGPGRNHGDLLGLAFEPVRSRDRPGVRGVLWLDAKTSELRSLEYSYTWMPWLLPPEPFGGETWFRRLPSGAWIVERWSIRMPEIERLPAHVARSTPTGRPRPIADILARLRSEAGLLIKEEGGEVITLRTADGVELPGPDRAALQGLVYDSIGDRPLPGARVRLEGTAHAAETDAEGRYYIRDLPAGVYGVVFEHPVLDEWALPVPVTEVTLERGDLTTRDLAVPTPATSLARGCSVPPGVGGPVVGRVVDATTGQPLAAAAVSLRLPHHESAASLDTWTDDGGVFRFCDVPGHGAAVLTAEFLSHAWEHALLDISPTAPVFQEIRIELTMPSRLTGRVVDAGTGEAVRGATIRLDGVRPERVTNADGHFSFLDVPPGTHRIEVAHLGYEALEDSLRVDGTGRPLQIDVRLATGAIELDPIVVSVASRPMAGALQPVYDRIERVRLWGGGTVFDRADLERRDVGAFTHLLRDVRNVRIESQRGPGFSAPIISSNRGFSGMSPICPMTVWVDGSMVVRGGVQGGIDAGADGRGIDQMISLADVEAVEVYHVSDRIPPEYWGSYSGCGVVLVWTRRGT